MTAERPGRDAVIDPGHGPDADGIVDAHVHVWDAAIAEYPWLADTPQLEDRYDLDDVADQRVAVGVGQVVLVQAADNVEDTEHLLAVAARDPCVAGVVGWLPLLDPDGAAVCLERWAGRRLVGARHLIHRDPDPDLLSRGAVDDVLAELADRALTFDVCAETTHLLGLVPALAERHQQLTLVIDHLAKPPIEEHGWEPWAGLLRQASEAPNVVAKLSGLNTAAGSGASTDDYQPYVDHALELFGPDRLMFGGDWPFALLASRSYREIVEPLIACLAGLDTDDRRAVLSGTARRVYALPGPTARHPPTRVDFDPQAAH